jgi:hypothetical protein
MCTLTTLDAAPDFLGVAEAAFLPAFLDGAYEELRISKMQCLISQVP